MSEDAIKLIFLGDITGRQGRTAVMSYIESMHEKPDFVIANIENASHGFGLTKKNYEQLNQAGIDCFTSGNHIWDKKDINEYIQIINDRIEDKINKEIKSKIKILNGDKKEKLIFRKKFNKIGKNTIYFIIEEKLNNMSFMFNNCTPLKEINFF